jgi:hypothetical protein
MLSCRLNLEKFARERGLNAQPSHSVVMISLLMRALSGRTPTSYDTDSATILILFRIVEHRR